MGDSKRLAIGTRLRARAAWILCGGALAGMLGLVLGAGAVRAEPYMAVRDGYKCSVCHVNKTGGGARTDFAAIYTQTRLAASAGLWSDAPEGMPVDAGWAHLGSHVSAGADLRTALIQSNYPGTGDTLQFNRPSGCDSCHASGTSGQNGAGEGGGGKIAEAFLRVQPIPDRISIVYSLSAVPNTTTRDFYGLLENLPLNGYVKVGTFKLPNGLQNTWDYPFQHVAQGGYQGNVGFETVYATGVEFGIEPGPLSIALSVTNPDAVLPNPNLPSQPSAPATQKRYFLTASAVGSAGLIGFNLAQDPIQTNEYRTLFGGFAGTNFGRVTILGQVDQLDDYHNPNVATGTGVVSQQAGLAEIDVLLKRGHNLKYLLESRDSDLSHPGHTQDRQSFIYDAFLAPYLQCRVGYRKYTWPANTTDQVGEQYFVETHFLF